MKKLLLLSLPSFLFSSGINNEAEFSQERYITSPIFDYSDLNPSGDLELSIKGTSLDVPYIMEQDNNFVFDASINRNLYFTDSGLSIIPDYLEVFSLESNNYYAFVIDFVGDSEWYKKDGYFVITYDNDCSDTTSYTKVGTFSTKYKILEDNRISILIQTPAELSECKLSFYVGCKESADIRIKKTSFINCGKYLPNDITTITNSYDKDTRVDQTTSSYVTISNCDSNSCSIVADLDLENDETEHIKVEPLRNGYLKFEAKDGYLNIDFDNSKVSYNTTFEAVKTDIQNNFNSVYHAYGNVADEMYKANQLDRLNEAKALGCKTLEMDLQFTSDNIPVMIHDRLGESTAAHVYNTATNSYVSSPIDVSTLTYTELLDYDFGYYYNKPGKRILKFADLLDEISSTTLNLNVELKSTSITEEQAVIIDKLLVHRKLESRVTFTSFNIGGLKELYKFNPSLNFNVIVSRDVKDLSFGFFLARALSLKSENNTVSLELPTPYTSKLDISIAHNNKIKYCSYIAFQEDDLSSLYLSGLDGATADNGNSSSYIRCFSNIIFQDFTWSESLERYQRTIDVNIHEPLTLSSILSQIKAYDNFKDKFVEVTLLSNDKNYPQSLKIGKYPIQLSAISSIGVTSLATLFINVVDSEAPVIEGPASIQSGYSNPKTITNITSLFSVSDDTDTTIKLEVVEDTYSANKNKIGEYSITLSATDASNNTTTRVVPVKVIDDKAPVITAPKSIIKNPYTVLTVSDIEEYVNAADEIDGELPVTVKADSFTGNGDKEGSYEVTYAARDLAGNGASKNIKLDVIPSITGNGYLVDNKTLVTYNDKLLSESDINSFLFASGLIDKTASETYLTVTTDTYTASYDAVGTYTYEVRLRTSTGVEKLIAIDVKVVEAEDGTVIKPDPKKEKWYETTWKAICHFFQRLWNLITKGKWEL